MDKKNCLNCGEELFKRYCANCGQLSATRRFTSLHPTGTSSKGGSIFDIPFLFTLKGLAIRPGHSVRGFLEGKRIQHGKIYPLLIIFLLVDNFILNHTHFRLSDLTQDSGTFLNTLMDLRRSNPKVFLLCTIPVQAVLTRLLFAGSGQNFIEHLYLNAYRTIAAFFISILFSISTGFIHDINLLLMINTLLIIPRLMYDFWFYEQYFSIFPFSKFSLYFRSGIATISLATVIMVLSMVP